MIRMKLVLERFNQEHQLLEHREQLSKSWLKHFFDLLYPMHALASLAGINDVTGAARTLSAPGAYLQCNLMILAAGGLGQTLIPNPNLVGDYCTATPYYGSMIGIVVGTGNIPVAPNQDALQTCIGHGEVATTLIHGGSEVLSPTFADPNGQFILRRLFKNTGGVAITVQEAGIYSPGMSTTASSCYIFCIARDVVAPGVTVNNGEILEATYTVQITV